MSLFGSWANTSVQAGKVLATGAYTAVAGDDTAGAATIATGLGTIDGFLIQVVRSDVLISSDQDYTASAGNLVVGDGAATFAVTAGDVYSWIAWGSL